MYGGRLPRRKWRVNAWWRGVPGGIHVHTMSNQQFLERAPIEVVEENRQRLADYQSKESRLVEGLERLV